MEQSFDDLCGEWAEVGEKLGNFVLWMFSSKHRRELLGIARVYHFAKSAIHIAIAVRLILLVHLRGNQYIKGWTGRRMLSGARPSGRREAELWPQSEKMKGGSQCTRHAGHPVVTIKMNAISSLGGFLLSQFGHCRYMTREQFHALDMESERGGWLSARWNEMNRCWRVENVVQAFLASAIFRREDPGRKTGELILDHE